MISNLAYVHPDAKIGNNVTIEPFATVYGNVEIGDNTWIGPNAVIMDYSASKTVRYFQQQPLEQFHKI